MNPDSGMTLQAMGGEAMVVSVVMPCLNEEATIGDCIEKAREGLRRLAVPGEILVADNGSTDRSTAVAEALGARIVRVSERGYGAAYRAGISAARGRIVVMGDSDGTYDFSKMDDLVNPLQHGADMVLGSRLRGEIDPGAMPWLHRYIGNPMLSGTLNLFFRTKISDTHSGLRAFTRDAYDRLGLKTSGMEFASEMLIAAAREGLRIVEVPIRYYPRAGESKLRSLRDGWRHLRLLLLYSPTHLFVVPGTGLALVGMMLLLALVAGPLHVAGRMIDFHFMFLGSLCAILGTQVATLGIFAKSAHRPPPWFTLERGLGVGSAIAVAGLAGNGYILTRWIASGFGPLDAVRPAILALTLMVVGAQIFFSSFYLDLLRTAVPTRPEPGGESA